MTDVETTIRQELKIPDEAQHVLILSMDAHMDWDWLYTFQDLVAGPTTYSTAQEIISQAFQLMAASAAPPIPPSVYSMTYYYSICEMGFFQGIVAVDPGLLNNFNQSIGDKLRIVGGGMTSPDNLLSHGETFIRDYLVGKTWMDGTVGLPLRQAYLPDDFGHDSQLPVLLEAMGFQGVSFSRIPGADNQGPPASLPNGQPSLAQQLLTNGADFVWQARDGSSVVAHWMQHTYCQGNGIDGNDDPIANILSYLNANQDSSPTPYIYVPCGCDFALPIDNLVDCANTWNQQNYHGNPNDVYAVVATLDHYIQLIATYVDTSAQHRYGPYKNLAPMLFSPTPYWTGFYASRIENKILHQAATHALLGAETFGAIADLLQTADALAWKPAAQARDAAITNGWLALVPSTHHDFITGTAVDEVYTGEQVPLLRSALIIGDGARGAAIGELAGLIQATPRQGETPIAIFNQLGFPTNGLVAELHALPGITANSVRMESGQTGPVQPAADGGLLFVGSAPSLGYATAYLSPENVTVAEKAGYTVSSDGTTYTLENDHLQAVIARSAGWGLQSLKDTQSGVELIAQGQTGNNLAFYIDQGGIYRFGNEYGPGNFQLDPSGTLTALDAVVLEAGPLRVRLRTTAQFQSQDANGTPIGGTYIREYTLVLGEPFLRMSLTGAAPLTADGAPNSRDSSGNQYAVMVEFPFGDPQTGTLAAIDNVVYGTPYHWVAQMPEPYWDPPIFQAMHTFILPQAGGQTLGAIYQSTIPAWAVDASGALIGCVLRNTPQDWVGSHGANGGDTGIHTHHYALRPAPVAAQGYPGIEQWCESLALQAPPHAAYVNVPLSGSITQPLFPKTFSLAAVTSQDAIITAAKAGTARPSALILRVYQPTNAALDVTISLGDLVATGGQSTWTAQKVTALETALDGEPSLPIANGTLSFTAARALTTLQIERA